MKSLFPIAILLACTGCSENMFATSNTPKDLQNAVSPKAEQGNYASDGQQCDTRAQQRVKMYDKPDTYPISDGERHDAYLALYSSCMREHNWQVAGPEHAPASTTQLANLAPAAGSGSKPNTITSGNTTVSTSSTPGATIVVIGGNAGKDSASQLSSLSPSSGGSAYPPNATVVLVQSPQPQQPAAYIQSVPAAPSKPLPVAVPVPPPAIAKGYMPAPPAPVTPQPSLAGAEAATTGSGTTMTQLPANAAMSPTQELENALEK